MRPERKQPFDWEMFGADYRGCVRGDHAIKVVLASMEAAERLLAEIGDVDGYTRLIENVKGITWH